MCNVSQIRISYGDALAVDELALFYGFLPPLNDQHGRLCAVHWEEPGEVMRGHGTPQRAAAEDDVTQGVYLYLDYIDASTALINYQGRHTSLRERQGG